MPHTQQETGERIARIETNVEHIRLAQATHSSEYAGAKRLAEVTFGEIKESFFQLRLNGETMLKMLDAAHKRIDTVDHDLKAITAEVADLKDDFKAFKQRITFIISAGVMAVSIFWAVLGSTVQGYVGHLFGR